MSRSPMESYPATLITFLAVTSCVLVVAVSVAMSATRFLAMAIWLGVLLLIALTLVWLAREWLFGPILWYELVRRARQGRQLLQRTGFGIAVLIMFYLVYSARFRPTSLADW